MKSVKGQKLTYKTLPKRWKEKQKIRPVQKCSKHRQESTSRHELMTNQSAVCFLFLGLIEGCANEETWVPWLARQNGWMIPAQTLQSSHLVLCFFDNRELCFSLVVFSHIPLVNVQLDKAMFNDHYFRTLQIVSMLYLIVLGNIALLLQSLWEHHHCLSYNVRFGTSQVSYCILRVLIFQCSNFRLAFVVLIHVTWECLLNSCCQNVYWILAAMKRQRYQRQ